MSIWTKDKNKVVKYVLGDKTTSSASKTSMKVTYASSKSSSSAQTSSKSSSSISSAAKSSSSVSSTSKSSSSAFSAAMSSSSARTTAGSRQSTGSSVFRFGSTGSTPPSSPLASPLTPRRPMTRTSPASSSSRSRSLSSSSVERRAIMSPMSSPLTQRRSLTGSLSGPVVKYSPISSPISSPVMTRRMERSSSVDRLGTRVTSTPISALMKQTSGDHTTHSAIAYLASTQKTSPVSRDSKVSVVSKTTPPQSAKQSLAAKTVVVSAKTSAATSTTKQEKSSSSTTSIKMSSSSTSSTKTASSSAVTSKSASSAVTSKSASSAVTSKSASSAVTSKSASSAATKTTTAKTSTSSAVAIKSASSSPTSPKSSTLSSTSLKTLYSSTSQKHTSLPPTTTTSASSSSTAYTASSAYRFQGSSVTPSAFNFGKTVGFTTPPAPFQFDATYGGGTIGFSSRGDASTSMALVSTRQKSASSSTSIASILKSQRAVPGPSGVIVPTGALVPSGALVQSSQVQSLQVQNSGSKATASSISTTASHTITTKTSTSSSAPSTAFASILKSQRTSVASSSKENSEDIYIREVDKGNGNYVNYNIVEPKPEVAKMARIEEEETVGEVQVKKMVQEKVLIERKEKADEMKIETDQQAMLATKVDSLKIDPELKRKAAALLARKSVWDQYTFSTGPCIGKHCVGFLLLRTRCKLCELWLVSYLTKLHLVEQRIRVLLDTRVDEFFPKGGGNGTMHAEVRTTTADGHVDLNQGFVNGGISRVETQVITTTNYVNEV